MSTTVETSPNCSEDTQCLYSASPMSTTSHNETHQSNINSSSAHETLEDQPIAASSINEKRASTITTAYSVNENGLKPPDGGFGWLVVIASFLCNFVVDGITFSFSIISTNIESSLGASPATTSWIPSLQAGCYLVIGPVASALANKYGCRAVTIAGSFIAALSFIVSYYATSVFHLMITYGILGGIGFGWIYLPAIVTVGYYFESKRALATGIAVCGSGIGTFVMPIVISTLLKYFQWNTCILILSSLVLSCAIFGLFFKPLNKEENTQGAYTYASSENAWNQKDEMHSDPGTVKSNSNDSSKPPSYSTVLASEYMAIRTRISMPDLLRLTHHSTSRASLSSVLNEPIYKRTRTLGELCPSRLKSSQTSLVNIFKRKAEDIFTYDLLEKDDTEGLVVGRDRVDEEIPLNDEFINCVSKVPTGESLDREGQLDHSIEKSFLVEDNVKSASSVKNGDSVSQVIDGGLISSLDLSLLASPSFLLLAISGFLTLAGFFVPFMYIKSRAMSMGYSIDEGAALVSIIGITNTFGRVFCGWISDQPRVNALYVNNISLIVGGLATIFAPIVCKDYLSLAIYGSIFGFSIACFAALRSVITVDLLGIDNLTNAYGLLLFAQGVAAIIGSPLAGWLGELFGDNAVCFYVSGAFILTSGLMCLPLNQISIWEKRRNEHKSPSGATI